MQRLASVLALLATLVVAAPAPADQGEIDPDRPDLANSTKIVPPGAAQIETGLEYARTSASARSDERRLAVAAALRIGVTERFEIQIGGEPLVKLRGSDEDTGPGDLTLGAKYRFLDARERRPALGLQPFLKLPLASAPIGSERPDFGIIGLASFDFPWNLGLDVNAGGVVVGQTRPNGYLLQALVAASLQRDLLPGRLQGFVELSFASREDRDGRDRVGADAGVIFRLTPMLALDAAVETSLAGPGPDYALRAGLSVRFGR